MCKAVPVDGLILIMQLLSTMGGSRVMGVWARPLSVIFAISCGSIIISIPFQ